MMNLTTDLLAKHLNLDDWQVENEKEYLQSLINTTEKVVEKHIDKQLSEIAKEEGEIPQPLLHAMLLLAASFYMQRESISLSQLKEAPQSYAYILSLYKNYKG